ncbi:hypothetical protein [Lacticaseibacillus sp. GG6-2]
MTIDWQKGIATAGRGLSHIGVDARQFTLIVQTKFLLTNRSPSVGLAGLTNKPSAHPLRNGLLWNLVIGVFLALIVAIPLPPVYAFSTFFATLMLIVFLTMLTGYSALMLDPKDRNVFLARGVTAATLNAARLFVVGWYLLLNTLTLGAPVLVPTAMRYGPLATLLTLVAELLVAGFTLVLALLVYLLVLRFFDGERLKNLLNLIQIIMIVGAYLASQLLPRLGGTLVYGQKAVLTPLMLLLPPTWFAGLPLLMIQPGVLAGVAAGLAVASCVLMGWFYVRHAARFEQYLAKLDVANSQTRHLGWYYRLCARVFAREAGSAGYFTLGWQMLRQEREFKLRVYPQFAYALVIPVIFAFNLGIGPDQNWRAVLKYVPYAATFVLLAIPVAVINLRFASHPEAMRIFSYVPFTAHGALIKAVVAAMFARMIAPFALGFGLLGIVAVGWRGVLILPAVTALLYAATLIFGRGLVGDRLPFATVFDPNRNAAAWNTMAPIFAGVPIAFGITMLGAKWQFWGFDLAVLVVSVIISLISARGYRQIHLRLYE